MCSICDNARKLPRHKGLALIATAMQQQKNRDLECLDATIGDIIGMDEGEVDKEKDAAWAKGTTWDKFRN